VAESLRLPLQHEDGESCLVIPTNATYTQRAMWRLANAHGDPKCVWLSSDWRRHGKDCGLRRTLRSLTLVSDRNSLNGVMGSVPMPGDPKECRRPSQSSPLTGSDWRPSWTAPRRSCSLWRRSNLSRKPSNPWPQKPFSLHCCLGSNRNLGSGALFPPTPRGEARRLTSEQSPHHLQVDWLDPAGVECRRVVHMGALAPPGDAASYFYERADVVGD
jgi:hypothetical protein